MASLLDTLKDKAKQVYSQGLLNQVITNPASVGQELTQLFDPSYMRNIKPMSQETAFDVALSAPMMAGTIKNVGKTSYEIAQDVAQQRATLPVSKGGLGLPANNTAMDRANALGFNQEAYTGVNTTDEITEMLPKSWFSEQKKYASDYSNVIPKSGISENPRVYPVLLKTGKVESKPYTGLYEDMEKALGKKRTNTFKVENVGGGSNNFYVIKDPNQVRSINAAFDPFRRNESDILAGAVAAPIGLLTVDENKKKKTTKK
jgi:hypothetical protein